MAGTASTVFGPFSFTSPNPPDATSVAPATGFEVGGTVVDIYGSDFVNGATIDIGGNPATGVLFVDAGHLICTTPAHIPAIVLITVTNPDTRVDPTPINFTYILDPPPTASFTSAPTQRSDGTYLVDGIFSMFKSRGKHLYSEFKWGAQKYGLDDEVIPIAMDLAEYSTDNGDTWNTATPQTYDRRHNAETPMNVTGTPTDFDFVWNAFWDLPENFDGNALLRLTMTGSPTVVITSFSFAVSTVVSIPSQTVLAERKRAFQIDDFLGEGPIAPWRRGPSDFMTARGKALVKSAVESILKTKSATDRWGGELEWSPDFGSLYWALKHAPGDEITQELAIGYTELALGQEPRIELRDVETYYEDIEGGRAMFIKVRYAMVTSNTPENQVMLTDLETVTVEV